jgi:hypothetical protein
MEREPVSPQNTNTSEIRDNFQSLDATNKVQEGEARKIKSFNLLNMLSLFFRRKGA